MDMTALPSLPPWAMVGLIIIGIVTILPLGTAILFVGSWVGRQQTELTGIKKELSDLQTEIKLLRERNHDLGNILAKHQQEIALEYVRHSALEKLEGTIMAAISALGTRIDQALLVRAKE